MNSKIMKIAFWVSLLIVSIIVTVIFAAKPKLMTGISKDDGAKCYQTTQTMGISLTSLFTLFCLVGTIKSFRSGPGMGLGFNRIRL